MNILVPDIKKLFSSGIQHEVSICPLVARHVIIIEEYICFLYFFVSCSYYYYYYFNWKSNFYTNLADLWTHIGELINLHIIAIATIVSRI